MYIHQVSYWFFFILVVLVTWQLVCISSCSCLPLGEWPVWTVSSGLMMSPSHGLLQVTNNYHSLCLQLASFVCHWKQPIDCEALQLVMLPPEGVITVPVNMAETGFFTVPSAIRIANLRFDWVIKRKALISVKIRSYYYTKKIYHVL